MALTKEKLQQLFAAGEFDQYLPDPVVTWASITGKPSTFPPSSHNHTKAQITDFPTSMPASDVYAWAKAATKPSYTHTEVGAAASEHNHEKLYFKDRSYHKDDGRQIFNASTGVTYFGTPHTKTYIQGLTDIKITIGNGTSVAHYNALHTGNYNSYVTPANIGAATSGHGHSNLQSFASAYSYENGLLVDITTTATSQMIFLVIRGNGYTSQYPIHTIAQAYHYTPIGTWLGASQINLSGNLAAVKFMLYNNRIMAWFPQSGAHQTITVEAYGTGGKYTPTISNAAEPAGSYKVTCGRRVSIDSGNYTSYVQKKITAGTAAPSGGVDGDIYLRYN